MKEVLLTIAQTLRRSDLPEVPNTGGVPENAVGDAITTALGVAGGIAVIAIVYGGIKYILSRGNPQDTAQAQNTILYALIGLVVCLFAVVIVRFVTDRL